MRHWLAILLLVFLPFQFSWAAVGTYCEHESGTKAQHFGHHEHEHRQLAVETSEDSDSMSKPGAALDVADCQFHCQCVVDLPASTITPMVSTSTQLTDWAAADLIAPVLSRPERPQWLGHA